MTAATTQTRDRERAAQIRSQILRSQDRYWKPADFKGPASTIAHVFAQLTRAGELQRPSKGLYWRGTKTVLGMSPPTVAQLLHALAGGPGVGRSGLSAANLLGLSTQIPRRVQVAVPGPAPRGQLDAAIEFVSRPGRTERAKQRLNGREVALFEVLADPSVSEIPPPSTWRLLAEELLSGRVRLRRLAKAARTEPAAARARLRKLLLDTGHTELASAVPTVDPRTERRSLALLGAAA